MGETSKLDQYHVPFKAVVLAHINKALGEKEWVRLRALASNRSRTISRTLVADPMATPSALLDCNIVEEGLSMEEMLIPLFKQSAVKIAVLERQPVYYVSGCGIYAWSPQPRNPWCLSFWVTFPAYPPGW
jgi:hypothetical protein